MGWQHALASLGEHFISYVSVNVALLVSGAGPRAARRARRASAQARAGRETRRRATMMAAATGGRYAGEEARRAGNRGASAAGMRRRVGRDSYGEVAGGDAGHQVRAMPPATSTLPTTTWAFDDGQLPGQAVSVIAPT